MRCFAVAVLVLMVASPGLSAAPAPSAMTSIENLTIPPDLQAQDVKLCMSREDFQAGPGKDFSLSLTLSTPANHVFLRDGEFRFLRILLFGRIGASVRLKARVEFSGDRLGAIRLSLAAATESDAVDIYDALHDQVLHAYSIAPSGPIFLVEDQKHDQNYARHARLLLVDKYGDALMLNLATFYSAVTLTYWARGASGSPGSNAAAVLLGRSPRFCEPVSEVPAVVPTSP